MNPLEKQVGGDHYKDLAIQPVEYCERNGLGMCASNVVKYVTRYKSKGGKQDLEKARHFIDLLIQLEYGEDSVMKAFEGLAGIEPRPKPNNPDNLPSPGEGKRFLEDAEIIQDYCGHEWDFIDWWNPQAGAWITGASGGYKNNTYRVSISLSREELAKRRAGK